MLHHLPRFTSSLLFLTILTYLSSATSQSTPDSTSLTPCLSPGESYNIALRWLQIFQTNENGTGTGSAIIPSTLTSNFTVGVPLFGNTCTHQTDMFA